MVDLGKLIVATKTLKSCPINRQIWSHCRECSPMGEVPKDGWSPVYKFGFNYFTTYVNTNTNIFSFFGSNPILLNWRPAVQWSFPQRWAFSAQILYSHVYSPRLADEFASWRLDASVWETIVFSNKNWLPLSKWPPLVSVGGGGKLSLLQSLQNSSTLTPTLRVRRR